MTFEFEELTQELDSRIKRLHELSKKEKSKVLKNRFEDGITTLVIFKMWLCLKKETSQKAEI